MQNRDKTKINMGMGGRATSTHMLMVDSARIRTVFVRETPNVSRRHTCKTETKPRATWAWAGGPTSTHSPLAIRSFINTITHHYNGSLSTKLHVNMRIVVYTGVQIGMWYVHSIQMDNHHSDSACQFRKDRPL